ATAQMERSLNSRFTRVANRFRRGLLRALRGSILGVGIGMITRLIQPLAALEERVKKLMGEGEELSDLAERMGAKPGQLKQLQLAGQALGMSPEKFNEMLTAYAEAVEEAKKEITDPERKDPLSKKAAILM